MLAALAAAPAAGAPVVFGVNADRVFNDQLPPGRAGALVDGIAASGLAAVRVDAFWALSEPWTRPFLVNLSWKDTDGRASFLATRGLRWDPVLDYSPGWQQTIPGEAHSAPRDIAEFGRWAGSYAERYGSRGQFWLSHPLLPRLPVQRYELWNEENGVFWLPRSQPARYADLYLAARRAVHAADPDAVVEVGGLAFPSAPGFLARMVAARPELRAAVDAVAIHPYGATPATVVDRVVAMRRTLRRLGLGERPLMVTEVGWKRSGAAGDGLVVPDRVRAGDLALSTEALASSDCGVGTISPYTWMTPERRERGDDWYGIVRPDGRPRPPARAYARVVATHPRPGTLRLCGRAASRRALPLGVATTPPRGGCRRVTAMFRGWPVGGALLRVTGRRPVRTGRFGSVRVCATRPSIRATIGSWARSPRVRLR